MVSKLHKLANEIITEYTWENLMRFLNLLLIGIVIEDDIYYY